MHVNIRKKLIITYFKAFCSVSNVGPCNLNKNATKPDLFCVKLQLSLMQDIFLKPFSHKYDYVYSHT